MEIVITTNLKRGQVGMKKYKLIDNISFLASGDAAGIQSFLCVCAVAHSARGHHSVYRNLVSEFDRACNRGKCKSDTAIYTGAVLGGLLVVLSLVNQYGKGIVSAESAYVRMKLTDMLNDHLMDCSYDMLGDKKVMQSLSQASQRIWSNTGFLVNAGENTVAFFSAVAGVVVYLAVLSKLPFG